MSPFKSSKGRNLGKLVEGFKTSSLGLGLADPSSGARIASGTENDPFTDHLSMSSTTNSGNYWFKTDSMTTATEYYLDCDTVTNEKYIRVWLSSSNNYQTSTYSWSDSETPNLIADTDRWMYAFCNPNTDQLTQAWTWSFYSSPGDNYNAFKNNPPMAHGGVGNPNITRVNATRVADNSAHNGHWLRTGYSSFSSHCDDGRSSTWGQICLKAGTSNSNTGNGGHSDFPMYCTFVHTNTDHCTQSNQQYDATDCSDTRRFAAYVRLTVT